MTREKASTPPCWRPAAATRLLAARRAWGRWRGEVLLVDCRRDYIECRLNIHYPLDAIFRPSLSCQRPTLGEQLVSRFLNGLQIGLCRWH